MTFDRAQWLVLLLVVPLLLWWRRRVGSTQKLTSGAQHIWKDVMAMPAPKGRRRWPLEAILEGLLASIIIVGISGPRQNNTPRETTILLDIGRAMTSPDRKAETERRIATLRDLGNLSILPVDGASAEAWRRAFVQSDGQRRIALYDATPAGLVWPSDVERMTMTAPIDNFGIYAVEVVRRSNSLLLLVLAASSPSTPKRNCTVSVQIGKAAPIDRQGILGEGTKASFSFDFDPSPSFPCEISVALDSQSRDQLFGDDRISLKLGAERWAIVSQGLECFADALLAADWRVRVVERITPDDLLGASLLVSRIEVESLGPAIVVSEESGTVEILDGRLVQAGEGWPGEIHLGTLRSRKMRIGSGLAGVSWLDLDGRSLLSVDADRRRAQFLFSPAAIGLDELPVFPVLVRALADRLAPRTEPPITAADSLALALDETTGATDQADQVTLATDERLDRSRTWSREVAVAALVVVSALIGARRRRRRSVPES